MRKNYGKTWVELDPDAGSTHMPVENRLAVEKALQQLPEDQREVVILKVFRVSNSKKSRRFRMLL